MKKLILLTLVFVAGLLCLNLARDWSQTLSEDDESNEQSDRVGDREEEEGLLSGADKQLASWWWAKAYPDPTYIETKYYQAWLHAKAMKDPPIIYQRNSASQAINLSIFNGNWIPIGPDQNIGGRILSIAIDPNNSNILFIGSASGGIWKTVTGGIGSNAWKAVPTGFPVLGVASIIINPSNSNIIYAATGEVYRTDTSNIGFNVWKARGTYGVGILKSIDGGETWTSILNKSLSNLFGVQMLEFDPSDPNTIYACATDGLYRSTDAGANWNKILDKIYVSDVVVHPSNPNLLLAAVGNLLNADKGIYRSANGGASWTKINSGLPASFEGFIKLDNASTDPDMVIASIGRDAGNLNELFRSTNFGQNWSVLSNSNHCQYQFWFAHDVAINPSNTNELVMGGVPLYNYNISLADRNGIGGVHADVHDIEFDPSNNNNVYVACDGGMYKSTDGGNTFSMINGGLQAVQFYASFAVSPTNPNVMIGGLQDNGVVRYNGAGWTTVMGGDGGPCVFHPTNGNIVFASNDARRVMRSTNGGLSFSEVLSSWAFVADSRTGFMAPLAIAPTNPLIIYSGSDNMHRSSNGGTAGTWDDNSYTTASDYIEAQHKTAIAMAVSPSNEYKVFVSTSPFAQYDNDINRLHINEPPNLLRTTDGAVSFYSIKNGLPDRFVMDIAINPNHDDSVWIVLGGFGSSHVYLSADGGGTWADRGIGLPDVPTNAILLDPANPSVVYIGNDLGVFVSPDIGATWYDFNGSLWDATLVMDLAVTSDNRLVAATHGKGAFYSTLYILSHTLITLNGKNSGNYNDLNWKTTAEANVLNYELERSLDGNSYSKIATVPARNNSSGADYAYRDNISSINNSNSIFYRLKMIDIDGQYRYSNVVNIKLPYRPNLIVEGNPFKNELRLVFNSHGNDQAKIRIYDGGGRCLFTRSVHLVPGINRLTINDLQGLPRASYIMEFQTSLHKISRKIIKQR